MVILHEIVGMMTQKTSLYSKQVSALLEWNNAIPDTTQTNLVSCNRCGIQPYIL